MNIEDAYGQWVQENTPPKAKRPAFPILFWFGLVLLIGSAGYGLFVQWQSHESNQPATITHNDLTFDDWRADPYSADWNAGRYVLSQAMSIWEGKVGYRIKEPALWIGQCFGSRALACANTEENKIIFTHLWIEWQATEDMLAVMLHEVGHLYGVPHIAGDKLMSANGVESGVHEPTPFAVAIAKEAKISGVPK